MQAREEVDEEVTANSRAVVLIISPAEESQRVVVEFGSVPQETIPVHRLFGGIVGDAVLPGTTGVDRLSSSC